MCLLILTSARIYLSIRPESWKQIILGLVGVHLRAFDNAMRERPERGRGLIRTSVEPRGVSSRLALFEIYETTI